MKKVLLLVVVVGMAMNFAYSQAAKQLNFGIIGVSFEIPVSSAITVGPAVFTNLDLNHLVVGAKANYYFDKLFGLPDAWDVYGGANIGFGIAMNDNQNSDLDLGLQIGGRWFWSEKWGVYLELGGGKLGGAAYGIGITMKI